MKVTPRVYAGTLTLTFFEGYSGSSVMKFMNQTAKYGAYSVAEFCDRYGISRAMFYKLRKTATGPVVMKVGGRTLISVEAADEWRRRMEAETQKAACA